MEQKNRKQKVKLIHSVYRSHKNGANTVIRLLLNAKDRFYNNGIDISGLFPSEEYRATASIGGIKTIMGTIRRLLISFVRKTLSKLAQKHSWAAKQIIYLNELYSAKQIVRWYLEKDYRGEDTVFFHTFFTCYYYLKISNKKQHTVVVLHTNGEPFKMERIYYPALEGSTFFNELLEMERFVFDNVDRISFVSKASMEAFLLHHPYVDANKVYYIHNGVEFLPPIEKNKEKNNVIEVCCVASITPRKGQHFIVEALECMQQKPKVHFSFVGDGSNRIMLEERVRKKGLSDYISFVGVTNEVDKYLVKSDIYILPSEDEGLPMAILEAMRASLPIVSTPVGGIPELLTEGYNGVFITPSIEGVKDFLKIIETTDWKKMGENSRRLFEEKFVVERMVDGYSRLLTF